MAESEILDKGELLCFVLAAKKERKKERKRLKQYSRPTFGPVATVIVPYQ
jgi:hypothetical protein